MDLRIVLFIFYYSFCWFNRKEALHSECFKGSDKATYTNDKLAIGHCDIAQKDSKMGDILYIALKQGFFWATFMTLNLKIALLPSCQLIFSPKTWVKNSVPGPWQMAHIKIIALCIGLDKVSGGHPLTSWQILLYGVQLW